MEITVSFPGGLKVDAHCDGFVIHTDQKQASGGEGSAPEPYAYFLSSIATCAGIYAVRFCNTREIDPDNVRLRLHNDWNKAKGAPDNIILEVELGADFPDKYVDALVRTMNQCSVKKTIAGNPNIAIEVL